MSTREWPAWMRASDILDLLRLSVPIAISRMSWMLMGVTDAIVLGQVAPQELPFVLNSWLPIGVSLGLGMGLLLGVQVMTSELLGQGRAGETGRVFRRGFALALVLGVVLMAVVYFSAEALFNWMFVTINPNKAMSAALAPEEVAREIAIVTRILSFGMVGFMVSTVCSFYLEALRRPLLVTVVMYVGAGVNLVLDLALVLGWWGMPQMGAEGVAWATTMSRWALTLAMLGLVIWLTPAFKASPPTPAHEAGRQARVGIGTAISNVAEWGGFNATYVIATFISLAVNAIYGYTVQIMGLCFMLFLGVSSATSVRVAEHFGRGNLQGVKDASRLGIAATFAIGFVLAIVLVVFGAPISRVLVDGEAAIDGTVLAPAIAALLIYAAIATTFDGLQVTASMALRAQGIVWLPTLIHVASFFVLMLPAGYLLGVAMQRGAQGMMEAALIGIGVAGLLQWGLLEWKTARHNM